MGKSAFDREELCFRIEMANLVRPNAWRLPSKLTSAVQKGADKKNVSSDMDVYLARVKMCKSMANAWYRGT